MEKYCILQCKNNIKSRILQFISSKHLLSVYLNQISLKPCLVYRDVLVHIFQVKISTDINHGTEVSYFCKRSSILSAKLEEIGAISRKLT